VSNVSECLDGRTDGGGGGGTYNPIKEFFTP
jgi:hypothetical protein